jgi:hypothetical protein
MCALKKAFSVLKHDSMTHWEFNKKVNFYTFFVLDENELSVSCYHCFSFLRKGTGYTFHRLLGELHSHSG